MKKALSMLKAAGMRKVNFAGGEPFLYPKKLAMLCQYCKVDLKLESVSIITNGTKVEERWLQENHRFIDVLGVSCDSFNEQTNTAIGRGTGQNVEKLRKISEWCRELNIKFKLNTVVCSLNWNEDMVKNLGELQPFRWKCFQVLLVESENTDEDLTVEQDKRRRNAKKFLIEDAKYQSFCARHKHVPGFVAESNKTMASSYLILDEYLRFLDKGGIKEKHSASILDVGVQAALASIKWDEVEFKNRGGIYDWSKDQEESACTSSHIEVPDW